MDDVLNYLRAQYSGGEKLSVSMEGKLESIFGEFKLPDEFEVRKLSNGPWNDPTNAHLFTEESLRTKTFKEEVTSPTPIAGWLMMNGSSVESMLAEFLWKEFNVYMVLSSIAYEQGMRFLEWAVRVTGMINKVSLDEALKNRPKTAAEELADVTVRLLGMRNLSPIIEARPFRDDVLVMFKIPVSPDVSMAMKAPVITLEKAISMCAWADKFDGFADKMEGIFSEMEDKISSLNSFRELSGAEVNPHPLIRFLDRDMMYPYNVALHSALFYRSRALADFLRKIVYISFK